MRPRLNALTTLRFFAALHVVLFHMRVVGILSGGPWWYQNFASIGYVGVNFFFVLSGFILVYTYEGSAFSVRKFWWARFARIYPAYVLSLIVAAPFFFFAIRHLDLPFFAWSKQHLLAACLLTIVLLQSWIPQAALTWNSVCWSLSVEAFFYLLFPLLLLGSAKFPKAKLAVCFAVSCLLSLVFSAGYLYFHPDGLDKINSGETTLFWKNILSFNPIVRLPEFATGVFAGRLFLAGAGKKSLATPLILGGLLAFVAVVATATQIPNPLLSAGFLSLIFAAIIYGAALQPDWASILGNRLLVLLGDASYSLYLLHSLIITRVFDSFPTFPRSARVVISLLAAILASILAYRLVEEPARRFLRRKSKAQAQARGKVVA
ncbi:MAG TPA: acyltransferase [Candidatus Acidoferrum sp.]|nr:acyltransferase [Candidatus Acidoferrum sp.]